MKKIGLMVSLLVVAALAFGPSASAIQCEDVAHDKTGTPGDDCYNGSTDNNEITGEGGDDSIHGNAGADGLYGNTGQDDLYGGNQNDDLLGGGGDDYLNGGDYNDKIWDGDGSDIIIGGNGTNDIWCRADDGTPEQQGSPVGIEDTRPASQC